MDWLQNSSIIPAIGVALTSAGFILFERFQLRIGLLALQYAFMTWLSANFLPLPIATVKLVTGILVTTILYISWRTFGLRIDKDDYRWIPGSQWFRILAVLLVTTTSVGLARDNWIGLPGLTGEAVLGATLLFTLGLLQLGFSGETDRIGIGLVSLLSGFEIIYAAIEPALAVLASLSLVHITIAMLIGILVRWDALIGGEGDYK